MIVHLAPPNVIKLWPVVSELIRPAVALSSTHSVPDVHRALLTMKAQLWVQLQDDMAKPSAAVITEWVDYPAGLFLRCWLAGADRDVPLDSEGFLEELDKLRVASGAIGFEAIGRYGWLGRFPNARPEGIIMRLVP